ncbi:hypothetical protein M408DRAFT_317538 [Serendipita vermifera MAFF 305830]|uniref:F-box domain-containing protein n=1 Tax=Serendipita vermifera MAFF 305830 TaxID=933852 RepID=A0A0C3AZ60_SERVB|nr:hypothetical protein M408DRAFT_317538 [Serendipita vermifera MAFF 305830]
MLSIQLDDADLFPRSNRHPTLAEEAAAKQILAEEEEDLVHLNRAIEKKQKSLDRAQEDVSILKESILKAKTEQAAAVQLRDHLRNGLEVIEGLDALEAVSRVITTQIENTDWLIRQETEALAIARTNFQGSLFVEQIRKQALDSAIVQHKKLSASIRLKKKNFRRPILRLPPEVWNNIFRETAYQPLCAPTYKRWRDIPKTWRQPFILSAVCHQWRLICRADPRLWKDPVIIIEDSNKAALSDLLTHCVLTAGHFNTLTIVAQEVESPLRDCGLCEQFSRIKSLNILIAALKFDNTMPALEELIIDMEDGYYFPDLIATIHQNGTNLRKLYFVGGIDSEEENPFAGTRTRLENLQEITMSCHNLLEYFLSNFVCPSLQKISFTTSVVPDEPDWNPFFDQGNLALTIKEVDICSMDHEDVYEGIIPFLDRLQKLKTLTVHGNSVVPIIETRISAMTDGPDDEEYSLLCFLTLEMLIIKSYTGTGEVILEYVEALQGLQRDDSNQDSVQDCLKAIVFEDCPDITQDVKSRIEVLYPDD